MASGAHCQCGKHLGETAQMIELTWNNEGDIRAISLRVDDVFGSGCYGLRANHSPLGCACGACGKQYVGRTLGEGELL